MWSSHTPYEFIDIRIYPASSFSPSAFVTGITPAIMVYVLVQLVVGLGGRRSKVTIQSSTDGQSVWTSKTRAVLAARLMAPACWLWLLTTAAAASVEPLMPDVRSVSATIGFVGTLAVIWLIGAACIAVGRSHPEPPSKNWNAYLDGREHRSKAAFVGVVGAALYLFFTRLL
jgi:hypothetical protein